MFVYDSFQDLPFLSKRIELFANKFDIQEDHLVLDCLEEMLNNRTAHPDVERAVDYKWLQNFPSIHVYPKSSTKTIT